MLKTNHSFTSRTLLQTPDLETPQKPKNPVGRPRIHPIKTPASRPQKTPATTTTPAFVESEESGDNNDDLPGKKAKTIPRNNQKSLNSTPSNRPSNYNNIMLIKNEQIVSNSSSLKQLKALNLLASSPLTDALAREQMLVDASTALAFHSSLNAERQQQNPHSSSLGVSDRMSKEKQKFFRFSVFNSERKSKSVDGKKQQKSSLNNNKSKTNVNHKNLLNGDASGGTYDKYKFVSSSDSEIEREIICDKPNKPRGRPPGKKTLAAQSGAKVNNSRDPKAKTKLKVKEKDKDKPKSLNLTSDSSCCSSDGEDSGSSSDSSSSSSGSSSSSSGSSSSANSSCSSTAAAAKIASGKGNLANKAESINTMNVFACINSRELTSQNKRPPYCWTPMPFSKSQQSDSLFKKHSTKSKSFGAGSKNENEVWGFAAEAKKSLNIFNNSDSESRTNRMSNVSGNDSDCRMSMFSACSTSAPNRISRNNRDAGSSRLNHQMPLIPSSHLRNSKMINSNDYLLLNRRTTSLMRNNAIMSSDDDAKQLSPSKLFRKAVSYKKFDNNTLNNKKLIMDTSLNGAKYGCDERPVKEPTKPTGTTPIDSSESTKQSQPPYNNNSNNQSDIGKKLNTESLKLIAFPSSLTLTLCYYLPKNNRHDSRDVLVTQGTLTHNNFVARTKTVLRPSNRLIRKPCTKDS